MKRDNLFRTLFPRDESPHLLPERRVEPVLRARLRIRLNSRFGHIHNRVRGQGLRDSRPYPTSGASLFADRGGLPL